MTTAKISNDHLTMVMPFVTSDVVLLSLVFISDCLTLSHIFSPMTSSISCV